MFVIAAPGFRRGNLACRLAESRVECSAAELDFATRRGVVVAVHGGLRSAIDGLSDPADMAI